MQQVIMTIDETYLLFRFVDVTHQEWLKLVYNVGRHEYYNDESIMSAEQCKDAIYQYILNGYGELQDFLKTAEEARIFYGILIKISDTTDLEKQKALYLIGKRVEKIIAEKEV